MAKSSLMTVNNVGNPEPVTVDIYCTEVVIGEDASVGGYPTTAYNVRAPDMTSDPIRVAAGKLYSFRPAGAAVFAPGTIGYVETIVGSTTFFKDQH